MIRFSLDDNWRLKLTESEAQQYDHKTIDVLVTGYIPEGWNWYLYIEKKCSIDLIPLEITDEGLKCTLIRKNLAYSGSYVAQIYATRGNDPESPDKRSSEEHFMIKHSVSGDLKWPEVPTAFTDAVAQAQSAAQAAEDAASHYPYIDGVTKHWMIWDPLLSEYIDTGIIAEGALTIRVVDQLPEASEDTTGAIYFVPSENPIAHNSRDEYVTIHENGLYSWEMIGSTAIDIEGKEDVSNKVTEITSESTDTQYPSAKAVYDYVEDSEHFIVSDTNPYIGSEDLNKLWIDPTDNTENPGGGGSSDLPLRITKSIEPGPGGSTVYDIEFT